MIKKKLRSFLRRLLRGKRKRTGFTKAEVNALKTHLEMHREIIERQKQETMTISGQEFDAAVEKFEEWMFLSSVMKTKGIVELGEAPLTETPITDEISIVRSSKLPKFLLSLGIRIRG